MGATTSCVADNHPLPTGGSVEFLLDAAPLYARFNDDLPRQKPFEKRVQLRLITAGAPDRGAYVDLQVDPPNALVLVTDPDEGDNTTCEQLPGVFRCTAEEDGIATLIVRSDTDWSGTARLNVVGRNEEGMVVVNPAGLPNEASNYTLIIQGLEGQRVNADYDKLACSRTPESNPSKWTAPRVREARLSVTPPPSNRNVVVNAPAIVQSLSSEVFVTRNEDCSGERTNSLVVQFGLDDPGNDPESPDAGTTGTFYFCFSDQGDDNVRFAYSSGAKEGTTESIRVAPEPVLLRVETTQATLQADAVSPVSVVNIAAFDFENSRVPMTVDIRSSNLDVLRPTVSSAVLPDQGEVDQQIFVTLDQPGTATIDVFPELKTAPKCSSEPITVVASTPTN